MTNFFGSINTVRFLILLLCFLAAGTLAIRESIDNKFRSIASEAIFIPPPKQIEYMSLGFNEVIADMLWVRWVQNVSACGKKLISRSQINKERNLTSEAEEIDFSYTKNHRQLVCHQGWSFRMLDEVTDLSPKFRIPYAAGATTLSVLSEDHIGAQRIYEKALKNFPNDWQILYRASYHYLFELNDFAVGSDLLKKAADAGGPSWLYSYSAKMAKKAGKVEFGIRVLTDYLKSIKNEEHRDEIISRINRLKESL